MVRGSVAGGASVFRALDADSASHVEGTEGNPHPVAPDFGGTSSGGTSCGVRTSNALGVIRVP